MGAKQVCLARNAGRRPASEILWSAATCLILLDPAITTKKPNNDEQNRFHQPSAATR